MKRIFYFMMVILQTILICCTNDNSQLEIALNISDSNRSELEKVLSYYKNDSLKLLATKFLIKNMPYHYSYKTDEINNYYYKIDSILTCYYESGESQKILEQLSEKHRYKYLIESDLKTIRQRIY